MTEPVRKKSTSSESELSDSWSLVEHVDTAPLISAQRHPDTPPPDLMMQAMGLCGQACDSSSHCSTHTNSTVAIGSCMTEGGETSSDAESVEIIHEDALLSDFGLRPGLSAIKMKSDVDHSCLENGADPAEKELTSCISDSESLSLCNINGGGLYSSERLKLIASTSALIALLLLLVSNASLFFKEQAYSKTDGLIVLPDEDLSSMIADLTLFKEENARLKEELNMIKYEYGNNKKTRVIPEEDSIEISSVDEVIGLEVISDEAPNSANPTSFKPSGNLKHKAYLKDSSTERTSDIPSIKNKIKDLKHLEEELNVFSHNIGLQNIVISSYNIAKNLENINNIAQKLNDAIDKQGSSKSHNKKVQLQLKLSKILDKVELDFKKSFERVSKRVNKFLDECVTAFCRIKGGISDVENIECLDNGKRQEDSKIYNDYGRDHRKKQRNEKFNHNKVSNGESNEAGQFNSNSKPSLNDPVPSLDDSVKNSESVDDSFNFNDRFKRNADFDVNINNKYDSDGSKHLGQEFFHGFSSDSKHHLSVNTNDKKFKNDKHYHNTIGYNRNKNLNDITSDGSSGGDNIGMELGNEHSVKKAKNSKDFSKVNKESRRKNKNSDKEGKDRENVEVKARYNYEDNVKDKSRVNSEYKEKLSKQGYQHNSVPRVPDSALPPADMTRSRSNEEVKQQRPDLTKCSKRNCIKKDGKFVPKINSKRNSESRSYNQYDSGKNPSGSATIHNESIYSKITSRRKADQNGEWYLELGETRGQKRANRMSRGETRSGWLFDRALVRDWCRTNSDSTLCASFSGQMCDYCV